MSVQDRSAETGRAEGLSGVFLPSVIHEASAAVLVVDLTRGEVTYANDLARELVPDQSLPLSVDAWSTAAGLEDVTGLELPDGEHVVPVHGAPAESLLRIAQGEPVTGEAVTAERATAVTAEREVLWVLGLPLDGAPDPISSLALVVFMPARNARLVAGAQESANTLRDRAVLATRMSFTITDPTHPDNPLVWVNPAFTATTGYTSEEVVGSNCRFLQGPDTDRRVVSQIRDALAANRPLTTTLLNYRKDGTPFWNELSISPIRDSSGTVTNFVGVQADVTARVEAQQTRDTALSQVARAADRLALLADFTSRMAMSMQPQQIIDLLADVLVPQVGTWVAVFTVDDAQRLQPPVLRHERGEDPAVAAELAQLHDAMPAELRSDSPVWAVLGGDVPHVLLEDYWASLRPADQDAGGHSDFVRRLGARSLAAVPLLSRSGVLGCVVLVADEGRAPLGESELALLRDLTARAGLVLENTQLYARQQQAAATLQRSLLPRLPRVPGIALAARYVPSADEAAVGGDWYDVFPLRDGGVGVVVGDVMGHNYDSAARMGKLSMMVRSYAFPGAAPHAALTQVDELITGSRGLDILATCLLATLHLHEGGAELRYSSAGHPPALVRAPDGTVSALAEGRGPMIGVAELMPDDARRPADARLDLPSGTTLICFTDGMLDAYAEDGDIDGGLAELTRITESMPPSATPRQVVDQLTAGTIDAKDDVAIVAIRID